jgi:hypothetical protein
MQKILLFILLTVSSVQSQNWTGIFNIENECNQTHCCCLLGPAYLDQPDPTKLDIKSPVSGFYFQSATVIDATIDYPTGFTTSFPFFNDIMQITLALTSNYFNQIYSSTSMSRSSSA